MSAPKDDLGLYVNFPVSDAIRQAPSDPEAAARVLLLAASLMRERKTLPYELLDYLADAFESMLKPAPDRLRTLALELNLTARNKRPSKVHWLQAYKIMTANEGRTDREIIETIKRETGCSKSHATRILNKAKSAAIEHERVSNSELD